MKNKLFLKRFSAPIDALLESGRLFSLACDPVLLARFDFAFLRSISRAINFENFSKSDLAF